MLSRCLSSVMCLALVYTAAAADLCDLVGVRNQTLRLPLNPLQKGYTTVTAFAPLTFERPTDIKTPPGETNRIFVLEQPGRVVVITNLAQPNRTVFLDLTSRIRFDDYEGLFAIAFHPGYTTNGYFFLAYMVNTTTAAGSGAHYRLARYRVDPANRNRALPASEVPLITQREVTDSQVLNDLMFGPDGYLYVAVGEQYNPQNLYAHAQRIDKDLFSGILRIDVDKRSGSLPPNAHPAVTDNYAIPRDNPFIGVTRFNDQPVDPARLRTEFYAVGLRNPWRMFIDSASGRFYCSDSGDHLREEINLIVPGGNYGWAYREGTLPGPRASATPAGFSSIDPRHEFPNRTGGVAIGGVVYRGQQLSQLTGAYLFADWGYGEIWALRESGAGTEPELLGFDTGITSFGTDPRNDDVLLADGNSGVLKRLVYSAAVSGDPLPATLDATGAFADLDTLTPQPGIVPYELNLPFWSDGAHKQRWFSVPAAAQITIQEGPWSFPTGAIWIKHFSLRLTNDAPQSARKLETRFLVRNRNGVYGVTYRWRADQRNADLVPEGGLDEAFLVYDQGVTRTQVWHYPARNECLACHTPAAGWVLGFTAPQLNRAQPDSTCNQLETFVRSSYLTGALATARAAVPLAEPADPRWSREYRVRSYLAANCAQCHLPGGSALGRFDARVETATANAGLIDGPLSNNRGDNQNRVVRPGSLAHSVLYQRMADPGPGHMPPIGGRVINEAATSLLRDWILEDLPRTVSFAQWQMNWFSDPAQPAAAAVADPDRDGNPNAFEYLTGTNPLDAQSAWSIRALRSANQLLISFEQLANRGFDLQSAPAPEGPWSTVVNDGAWQSFGSVNQRIDIPVLIGGEARYYRMRLLIP